MVWLYLALKIILSVIALAFTVGIFYFFVKAIRERFTIRQKHEHQLYIHHKANFRAFYYLAIEPLQQSSLQFQVLSGSVPLAEISQPATSHIVQKTTKTNTVVQGKENLKPTQSASSAPAGAAVSGKGLTQNIADSGSKTVAKAGVLANLLGAFAGLLPGSLGDGVRRRQQEVRAAQVNAAKAVNAPKQTQQRLDIIQSESQKLGGKSPTASNTPKQPTSGATSGVGTNTKNVKQANQSFEEEVAENEPVVQHPFANLYCVRTFELDPEQSLPLKLIISSSSPKFLQGSFSYLIHLQAVSLEHLQDKLPALSKYGTVHYEPISAWRRFIPGFVSLLMLLVGVFWGIYLLTFIWY